MAERDSDAARRRIQLETRRKVIAALGLAPEPEYPRRGKIVTPEERARRAGYMYAMTTGEFLRELKHDGRQAEVEAIVRAEREAFTKMRRGKSGSRLDREITAALGSKR